MGEEAAFVKTRAKGEQSVYVRNDVMLQKGLKNIGGGLGWLVCLTILAGIKVGSFGFIFIGLGISQLVIWKLSGTRVDNVKAQD